MEWEGEVALGAKIVDEIVVDRRDEEVVTDELLDETVETIVVVVLAGRDESILEFFILKYSNNVGSENTLKLLTEEEDDFLFLGIEGKFNEVVEAERFLDFFICRIKGTK